MKALRDYYRAVAPYYEREMRGRGDAEEWAALARAARPSLALDLGCGNGRVADALRRALPGLRSIGVDAFDALGIPAIPFVLADMRALPFAAGAFDLVAAGNDPFAHLLADDDRARAVAEARRVLAPGGTLVIDGLWLNDADRHTAREGELVRQHRLDGVVVTERWHARGADRYEVCYVYDEPGSRTEACAQVRAWTARDRALQGTSARIRGSIDGAPFDPSRDRIVLVIGGPA